MSLDNATKVPQTSSGYTDSTSADTFSKGSPLTKSQANKLLDEVKVGIRHHPVLVTQALITTGDWTD